jgi:ANTAR domain
VDGDRGDFSFATRTGETVAALFARDNPVDRVRDDPMAALEWVCRTSERLLGIDGACVSLIVGGLYRGVLCASDPVLARIEAAQFSLAEGPCWEATASFRPVLIPDFAGSPAASWPVFASQTAAEPVGAFYAFPLPPVADGLGALAMYRREPGGLSAELVDAAVAFADLAAVVLLGLPVCDPDLCDLDLDLGRAPVSAVETSWVGSVLRDQAAVNQAEGVVMVEFRIDAAQALARLRAHAFATGRSLVGLATELTSRRLHPRELGT